MKFNILLVVVLLSTSMVYAQLNDPITATQSPSPISSDYGPRCIPTGTGSIFHKGIDYPLIHGDEAYAVDPGDITLFGDWGSRNAYIRAGNYTYVHVEDDNTQDYTWEYVPNVLDELEEPYEHDDVIFLRENINNSLSSIRAITTILWPNEITKITDTRTNAEVDVITYIESGDWIFTPTDWDGDPTTTGGDHLHLGRSNRDYNPFRYVVHNDNGAPILTDFELRKEDEYGKAKVFDSNNNDHILVYGDKAILQAKAKSTGDKDIDQLSVTCSHSESEVIMVETWRYSNESDQILQNCDEMVEVLEPFDDEDLRKEDIREGLFPFTETPSSDYFKFHWNSVENEDEVVTKALVNESAVYPDGEYEIEFKVTDIMGNENSENTNVILDNHQPYVKRVDIINGERIYSSSVQFAQSDPPWDLYQLLRQVDQSNQNKFGVYDYDVEIIVEMSEAMHYVHLEIEDTDYSNDLTSISDDARTWNCIIPTNELLNIFPQHQSLTEYTLYISGVDLTEEHEVLDLNIKENEAFIWAHFLPSRDESGEWENDDDFPRIDKDHKLVFCGYCVFLRAIFEAQKQDEKSADQLRDGFTDLYGHSPLTISFSDQSVGEPESWIWDFGDMQGVTNEQYPEHTFYNFSDEPAQFNISLKVSKEDASDITIKNKLITVYPAGYDMTPIPDFDFEQITNSPPYRIDFNNYSSGPIQEFEWDFDDDNTNTTDFEPIHFYEEPRDYDITLTLNPGYADEESITRSIQITATSGISSEVDFSWICWDADNPYNGEGVQGSLINLTAEVSNPDALIFGWEMGDGIKFQDISDPWHTYGLPGNYLINLKVFDLYNNLIGQKSKLIQVVPNTLVIQPANNEITFDNLISDIELLDDEDIMFVAEGSMVHVYNFNIDNTTHPWVEDQSQLINVGNGISNIAASGDNLLVACAYQDDLKGAVHCYSKVNGTWQEENSIVDPDYAWFWRFGQFMEIDQNHAIISAYNEQGKKHKITLWEYEPSSGQWVDIHFFYTASDLPTPPKMEIYSDVLIINSDVYTYQGDSWVKVKDDLPYNDSYTDIGFSTITMDGNIMMATQQCIENSYAHLYKIDNNQPVFMNSLFSPGSNSYARAVSKRNNYIIAGNTGTNYDCDFSESQSNGSAILFRSNEYDYYYRYRTFTPENGIEADLFGKKVEMNKNHIIVYSEGRDDDIYKKDPSLYYYNDYMYLCDKTLYLNSKKDLKSNRSNNVPINARIIEVAGNRDLTLRSSDNVKMVGQKITLKPGFSVVEGGTLLASGTYCLDCYEQDDGNKTFNLKAAPVQDTILSENIVEIDELFNIYPNPATGFVIIEAKTPESYILNLKVLTLQGIEFYNMSFKDGIKEHKIDVSNFKPGHYVLQIEGEKGVSSNKLVKL